MDSIPFKVSIGLYIVSRHEEGNMPAVRLFGQNPVPSRMSDRVPSSCGKDQ
jgi:hypothetical protein